MKICSGCKKEKTIDAFSFKNKSKGIYQSRCKPCYKIYRKDLYEKDKSSVFARNKIHKANLAEKVRQLKDKPCHDCGIKYPYYVMQFDHLRDKEFHISHLKQGWAKIQKEAEKCEIVCANCHAERTHKRYYNMP